MARNNQVSAASDEKQLALPNSAWLDHTIDTVCDIREGCMTVITRMASSAVWLALVFVLSQSTTAQTGNTQPAKKVLTFADEGIIQSVTQPTLSDDGTFAVFTIQPTEGDGVTVVHHLPSSKEYRFARGSGSTAARFSPDGKRVVIALPPTKEDVEKAKAAKGKAEGQPQTQLAIIEVDSGTVAAKFPLTGTFTVGGEGAGVVVFRKPAQTTDATSEKTEQPTGPMVGKGGGKLGGKVGGKFGGQVGSTGGQSTNATSTFGTELVLYQLGSKKERILPDVSEFSLTKDGKLLVYTVAARKDEANGVYGLDLQTNGKPFIIKSGPGRYSNLTWDEKQTKLAFLFDDSVVTPPNQAPMPRLAGQPVGSPAANSMAPPTPRWHALVWKRPIISTVSARHGLSLGAITGFHGLVAEVVSTTAPNFDTADEVLGPTTPGLRTNWSFAGGSLAFSADGNRLFVNTAPKRSPEPPATPPRPDDFTLEIWHWKDERLQPAQKLQASADQRRTYSAVVHLDTKSFRQLSDETITVGLPPDGSDWAIGRDDRKYRYMTGYMSPLPTDYSLVNIKTGESRSVLTNSKVNLSLSPTGKYLLGFDGKDWFTFSVPDGKRVNLTEKLSVRFYDELDDHPGSPRAAGQPLWSSDGRFVLVNDRYDIWKLAADGSTAENITKIGRGNQTRFTIVSLPTSDETEPSKGVDLTRSLLLAAENLHTRDTGFYRLEQGKTPQLLIMGARRYGLPIRAKHADIYLLTVQTFSEYPDYFATNSHFHELKRITNSNPIIKTYNWGRAELIHYSSADGIPLSGILIKPENFDPSKKYPMVVYIYERLSQNLHQFRAPTTGTSINPTFYASNGYLVLMPDIAYQVGSPGQSALKCVLPAIQSVVDKGYVKEDGIGIQGHSWGGYQIAYMITQTNRFKAAIAGAPVSNMVSAYGGIRWESGLTRQFQYEWTQSRIGAPLWDAPMKYIENSPIFMADRVRTPLLMLHNDQDGAVPWYQGIEYYLALRRLGKECYMLNYNGQPHGLTNRAAARDYSVRMFQFFEHHLKGQPAPAWMEKGVPYLEANQEKEQWKKLFAPEKK
jgi:dipeptidyl aminopeptidase/acylaminoacyl peptidase